MRSRRDFAAGRREIERRAAILEALVLESQSMGETLGIAADVFDLGRELIDLLRDEEETLIFGG